MSWRNEEWKDQPSPRAYSTPWKSWMQQQTGGPENWRRSGDYQPRHTVQATPCLLVNTLIEFESFSASLQELVVEKCLEASSLKDVISNHKQLFCVNGTLVELKPQVGICSAHSTSQGCQKSSCGDIHICSKCVMDWCNDKTCPLGHTWKTDHNVGILTRFSLEQLSFMKLRKLFRFLKNTPKITGKLDVCRKYNDGGCDQSDCGALHVCLDFMVGLSKCPRDECKLNHNLLSPDCCQLLKSYGFSINEAPLDTILALHAANPNLSQGQQCDDTTQSQTVEEESDNTSHTTQEDNTMTRPPKSGEDDQKNEMGSEDGLDEWVKVLQNIQVQEEETRNKLQRDNWRQRSDEPLRYNWKQLFERNSNKQYEPPEPLSPVHVTPRLLVDSLVGYPKFSASIDELMMEKNMNPSDVQEVVSSHTKVFYLLGNTVQLSPQVSICKDHSGAQGCQKLLSCSDLHICPNFVTRSCQDENCSYGHTWLLDHNRSILHQLCIDWLPSRIIFKLIQQRRENIKVTGPLQVCFKYNGGGCDQTDCAELHVCFTFLTGLGKCSRHDCQLNHNFLTPDCCRLLRIHGLPVNETPRDIVLALLFANPTLLQEQNTSPQQIKKKRVNETLKSNKITMKSLLRKFEKTTFDSDGEEKDTSGVITEDGTGSSESSNTLSGNSNLADVGYTVHVNNGRLTLWSYYLLGNVEIPEICYHSVEDMCKNEGSGCQRLHATQHFHWQVCEADRWINLRPSQVTCLERAFCDPSQDGVDLPRLDPATLDHTFRGLLILLGRVTWHADFKTMNLTDSTKTKTLPTRRLCTETVPGQVIKPATFIWYFLDKNNKWVQYGNVDTAGESHLVSSATTSDIDMHYKKNSLGSISFKNSKFTYILNFKTMMQTNLKTHVSREVRRRPEPHLQDEKTDVKDQKTSTDLPSTWEVMQPEERMRLITLAASSTEYQTVVGLLGNRVSSSNVMKVQRVQNPFLWRALQNKIKELTAIYGDAATVAVRQLFHGTNHNVVSSICSENFDWRLHGSSSGQSFGRGTYFSTDPAYSYNYCGADPLGMKYMFVARTAVGSFTRGDSGMVRPPTNPKTNLPFDSTVNNVRAPSIIVKYDKQEYYPEYILTLA